MYGGWQCWRGESSRWYHSQTTDLKQLRAAEIDVAHPFILDDSVYYCKVILISDDIIDNTYRGGANPRA